MGNLTGFNANNVEPDEFAPLPADDYTVCVVNSEFKPNKKKNGHVLELELQVIQAGEFHGRKIWNNLNLDNPHPTSVKISEQRLSELSIACGIPEPDDSSELYNIPVIASIEPDGSFNKVKKYSSAGHETQGQSKQTADQYDEPINKKEGTNAAAPLVDKKPANKAAPAAKTNLPPWKR